VLPLRVSLTQRGAVAVDPVVLVLIPPAWTRRWNAVPFDDYTSIIACADEASSVSRIITAAFTQTATF